jgi:Paraquat-inducible protein A
MAFITQNFKKIFSSWLIILSVLLLSSMIYTITHLIETGKEAKVLKVDYEQLHSLQYGLLNSNVWTEKITTVFRQKIDEFDFTSTSREEIKKYVETVIDTLIVEADKTVRRKNEQKRGFFKSLLGDTKQMITDELVDIRNLRKKVPQYTNAVMNELEKPANQKILKAVMKDKLHQFMKTNLDPVDMSGYNQILEVYQCNDFETCSTLLDAQLKQKAEEMNLYTIAILSMAAILIILIILQGTILKSITLLLLSLTSIALLIPGLLLPMLDIEAKINKLYFIILEKPLTFTDQVIFFKSKSISDLVHLLLESDEIKMIFVGVLLIMFSIIFPTLKLVSTYLYFYSRSFIGNNAIVRFFALRSTKWSMADVMVVSIFMAYLGLDSMIENELKKLVEQSAPVNVITSNGTDLQVGFFLFLGFVFTSFVLSILVEKSRKDT